ncbi:MAG TPA: cupredoxin domain-containing protein [Candidatus Nanoarchaeia archaeon]|nr:cupredoxin domain-containing protein [Candidatus Nanoarchaeia archaeon]
MKKIIFLLCVLAILALSACGKQNSDQIVGQGSDVPVQAPAPAQNTAQNGDFKEFKITAKQFEFTPSTIEVNKGDKVKLVVTSVDVPHGIAIKEYGINEQLPVGKPVTIEFTADKAGTFTAYCSVFCGSGHSNMKGNLVVK